MLVDDSYAAPQAHIVINVTHASTARFTGKLRFLLVRRLEKRVNS
jgi:hypothetical protein